LGICLAAQTDVGCSVAPNPEAWWMKAAIDPVAIARGALAGNSPAPKHFRETAIDAPGRWRLKVSPEER
jgi:hypothetical protein